MNLTSQATARATNQLQYLRKHRDKLVIDADTHISDTDAVPDWIRERLAESPTYFHGKPIRAEELIREMDSTGVDMALCWQNPAATVYTGDQDEDYRSLLAANRYIFEASLRYPNRIIPAGWTDPRALGVEGAIRMAAHCTQEFGCGIIKINPAQNEFPIDSAQVFSVVDAIYSSAAIPAFHFGADTPYTPPEGLETVARKFAPEPLLAIHMGGGGAAYTDAEEAYGKSREIGLRNPNIRYILSAKRDTHIESDLIAYQSAGDPWSKNLLCASDAPYGLQSWNYGGFREMFRTLLDGSRHNDPRLRKNPGLFSAEAVAGYLGGNFASLMIDIYTHLLHEQE
jgi:predicted TIM-barrel fold metal-dependent hydrolase